MKKVIKVGSRDSKLAVTQTELVMNQLRISYPEITFELITLKTTGDLILDRTLDKIGGKGLFVKELDQALLDGRIDIAVHSLKDLPMEVNEDLPIGAMFERGDPRDVLVLREDKLNLQGDSLRESKSDCGDNLLKENKMDYEDNPLIENREALGKTIDIIGSSSARRALQAKLLFEGTTVNSIRGNIISRLQKLDRGDYDGLILAGAGLIRAGLIHRINRYFSVEEMIPAAGQGILAIQTRRDFDNSLLECINNKEAEYASIAEREFVRILNGGCGSPIAAYAEIKGNDMRLTGLYYNEETKKHTTGIIHGDIKDAKKLGEQLAEKLKGELS